MYICLGDGTFSTCLCISVYATILSSCLWNDVTVIRKGKVELLKFLEYFISSSPTRWTKRKWTKIVRLVGKQACIVSDFVLIVNEIFHLLNRKPGTSLTLRNCDEFFVYPPPSVEKRQEHSVRKPHWFYCSTIYLSDSGPDFACSILWHQDIMTLSLKFLFVCCAIPWLLVTLL